MSFHTTAGFVGGFAFGGSETLGAVATGAAVVAATGGVGGVGAAVGTGGTGGEASPPPHAGDTLAARHTSAKSAGLEETEATHWPREERERTFMAQFYRAKDAMSPVVCNGR